MHERGAAGSNVVGPLPQAAVPVEPEKRVTKYPDNEAPEGTVGAVQATATVDVPTGDDTDVVGALSVPTEASPVPDPVPAQ